jgi:hypothetical protein
MRCLTNLATASFDGGRHSRHPCSTSSRDCKVACGCRQALLSRYSHTNLPLRAVVVLPIIADKSSKTPCSIIFVLRWNAPQRHRPLLEMGTPLCGGAGTRISPWAPQGYVVCDSEGEFDWRRSIRRNWRNNDVLYVVFGLAEIIFWRSVAVWRSSASVGFEHDMYRLHIRLPEATYPSSIL